MFSRRKYLSWVGMETEASETPTGAGPSAKDPELLTVADSKR